SWSVLAEPRGGAVPAEGGDVGNDAQVGARPDWIGDGYRYGVSGSQELQLRRAGRVIVLDPEDRVLLFRYDEAPPNGRHWCTPGGGLDDEEDYPAGARRELTEETGWTDVPIGPEVYEHVRIMEYADAM